MDYDSGGIGSAPTVPARQGEAWCYRLKLLAALSELPGVQEVDVTHASVGALRVHLAHKNGWWAFATKDHLSEPERWPELVQKQVAFVQSRIGGSDAFEA